MFSTENGSTLNPLLAISPVASIDFVICVSKAVNKWHLHLVTAGLTNFCQLEGTISFSYDEQ